MIPDDDFVSEIADIDGGPSIRITVRRTSIDASLSVILHTASSEETTREDAIKIAIGKLKMGLGWEPPYQDFAADLVEHRYFCGAVTGCVTVMEHKPSGIASRPFYHRDSRGRETLHARNQWMEEFVLLLWEAGIRPQSRKDSVKRLGKPRWSEK